MGLVGETLDDLFDKIEHFISFFIIYSVIVFVLGVWFGTSFKAKEIVWYPVYILIIALFLKVVIDVQAGKKKAKK